MGDINIQEKFGQLVDLTAVAAPDDVWDTGGDHPGVLTAATTTLVSDSANDDVGNTGAEAVHVYGINDKREAISEIVATDGTTPVALANDYAMIFRMHVEGDQENIGNIQAKHGATVLSQISAAKGQTLMAVYCVPTDYAKATLTRWYVQGLRAVSAAAAFDLMVREPGQNWRVRDTMGSSGEENFREKNINLPPGSEVKVRCIDVSGTMTVNAGFNIDEHRNAI